jgi:hypothetical protein
VTHRIARCHTIDLRLGTHLAKPIALQRGHHSSKGRRSRSTTVTVDTYPLARERV